MTQPTPIRTALVTGPNGGFGQAAAAALIAHGWTVKGLSRRAPSDRRIEWIQGDATDAAAVTQAAQGVQAIVQGAHPAGYRNWGKLIPALLQAAVAAAQASGARLVHPASLYNFDPDDGEVVSETSPQNPRTGKGRLRRQAEAMLRRAAEDRGVKVLILRAGDFFGPPPAHGWLTVAMVRPGVPLKSVTYPGRKDVGHAWAYLPDLGEALARLLDQEARLGVFESFNFGGHWLERGIEMAQAVRRAARRPDLPVRSFPWPVVQLIAPFSETLRGVVEMSWLWRRPLRPDNSRLLGFLGAEPHTPLDEAVGATLRGIGALPAAAGQ